MRLCHKFLLEILELKNSSHEPIVLDSLGRGVFELYVVLEDTLSSEEKFFQLLGRIYSLHKNETQRFLDLASRIGESRVIELAKQQDAIERCKERIESLTHQ